MNKHCNLCKVKEVNRPKRARIVPTVNVVRTIVRPDGLVESIVERIESPKDSYRDQNWRNFQVQTILQTESIDLLKEVAPHAVDPLSASDGISRVSLALGDLNAAVAELRRRSVAQPVEVKQSEHKNIEE